MEINVFTDGSFSRKKSNPVQIKCGYGIYFPNGELNNISEPFNIAPQTNQRAELYAIYVALLNITENIKFKQINLYTDSEYSLNSLTKWAYGWEKKGWTGSNKKELKNLDIIQPTFDILKKYKAMINIIHVYSHTGKQDKLSIGNEMADKLANDGANKEIKNNITLKQLTKPKPIARQITKPKTKTKIQEFNFDYSKIKILKIGNKKVIVEQ